MIDREPMEEGILDFCREHGIGFIAFSPLAQGLLTDRYLNGIPADSRMAHEKFLKSERLTPEYLNYILNLKTEAEKQGKTIAQAALAWILQQQGVTSVLVGASSVNQLAMNIKCV
jgi:L-glyceraldehyde 3-phosphate reductase